MLTKWSYVNARIVGIPLVTGGAAAGALATGVGLSSVDWLTASVLGLIFGLDVVHAEHRLVAAGAVVFGLAAGVLYGAASPDPSTATKCGVVALMFAPLIIGPLVGRVRPDEPVAAPLD